MRLDRCRLSRGDPTLGTCEWCGDPLPARHRRWCSDACAAEFRDNHFWPWARERALRDADRRCIRCAMPEGIEALEVHHDPPLRGKGRNQPGCQHHQEKLHVLCHDDHVLAHRVMEARPGSQLALFRAA